MPTGGKRDKAKLRYEDEVYTPEGAKTLTDKELRAEYSRLRSIARKRLERFEGTEWTDTQVYQLNVGVYKPLPEIKNNRELRHLLSDVARFVTGEVNSVSGLEKQRRHNVKELNKRGYGFINKENYRSFADFMEYARIVNLNWMYDSKRIAEFYEWAEKKKISGDKLYESFRTWNKNEHNKQKRVQHKNPRNSDMYRKDIE
jgi:hypothetical protein